MDNYRIGLEYFSSGIPVRVTGNRGIRLGDTQPDPKTRRQTFWFKSIQEWEDNRVAIFTGLGRHAVNYPVPRIEPIYSIPEQYTEDQASADIEAGMKAEKMTVGATLFFFAGVVLGCLRAKASKAEEQQQVEAAATEEEQAANDYATGAALARERKELPADASEEVKGGYNDMKQALAANGGTPAPSSDPPENSGGAEAPPDSPPEQTPAKVDINASLDALLKTGGHRLKDAADALKMDPTALRAFLDSPHSMFALASGSWIKHKIDLPSESPQKTDDPPAE